MPALARRRREAATWSPAALFDGLAGFWAGGFDPAAERLLQAAGALRILGVAP